MTGKHSLIDALKHVAFEDDPAPAPKHPEPPSAITTHAAPPFVAGESAPFAAVAAAPVAFGAAIDAGVVPDNDSVYQTLLARTDFEKSDIAATIHKFLDPLKAIPDSVMPSNVKFKTAVLQASAQAGLTEDGILAAFDALKIRLEQEKSAFEGKAQQFVDKEISARQEHIQQITDQITNLQQELGRESNELVEAQGKAAHAQGQFQAAVQRRASEIEQQKALYSTLLKG